MNTEQNKDMANMQNISFLLKLLGNSWKLGFKVDIFVRELKFNSDIFQSLEF